MTATDTNAGKALPPLSIKAWLRWDVVARRLAQLQPRTVLEVGCGQGSMGARVADGRTYLGVEPDESSYVVARERVGNFGGTVILGTHQAVPTGSTYDLVCAFEVLEHIEDDHAALADWVTFVRPGGHLLLSVPGFQAMFGPMDTHAGHFRRYEPDDLRQLLEAAGLQDVQLTVYGWPLSYALEIVRNRVDAKKLAATSNLSPADLTAASGRTFQPSKRMTGEAVRLATLPFRYLQRVRPAAGTGLIVVARKPAAG